MIVVLDTNVWVSALHFAGRQSPPIRVLELIRNRHTVAICEEIESEIAHVLVNKFDWQLSAVRHRLGFFLIGAVRIVVRGTIDVCRDPKDNMVLECAMLGQADTIVSGDKDLLVLGTYENIRIVTPAQFLEVNSKYTQYANVTRK